MLKAYRFVFTKGDGFKMEGGTTYWPPHMNVVFATNLTEARILFAQSERLMRAQMHDHLIASGNSAKKAAEMVRSLFDRKEENLHVSEHNITYGTVL